MDIRDGGVLKLFDVEGAWKVEVLVRFLLPSQHEGCVDLQVASPVRVNRQDCDRDLLHDVGQLLDDHGFVVDAIVRRCLSLGLDAVPNELLEDSPIQPWLRLSSELKFGARHDEAVRNDVLTLDQVRPLRWTEGLLGHCIRQTTLFELLAGQGLTEGCEVPSERMSPCVGEIELSLEASESKLLLGLWVAERLFDLQHRLFTDADDCILARLSRARVQADEFPIAKAGGADQHCTPRADLGLDVGDDTQRRDRGLQAHLPKLHMQSGPWFVDDQAVDGGHCAVNGLTLRGAVGLQAVPEVEVPEGDRRHVKRRTADHGELHCGPFVWVAPGAGGQWHEDLRVLEVHPARIRQDDAVPDGLRAVQPGRASRDAADSSLDMVLEHSASIWLILLGEPQVLERNLQETWCLATHELGLLARRVVPRPTVGAEERCGGTAALEIRRNRPVGPRAILEGGMALQLDEGGLELLAAVGPRLDEPHRPFLRPRGHPGAQGLAQRRDLLLGLELSGGARRLRSNFIFLLIGRRAGEQLPQSRRARPNRAALALLPLTGARKTSWIVNPLDDVDGHLV
mmetsp:Transcript_73292/g.238457  ORF Transcript_73292/g.238457 Transcript_73292/m.238457 type:complete len:569 (+) Transcript_73292:6771-8477(+)